MTKPNLFTEDPIDELTSGYRTTQVVVTAARLGVFAKLEEASHDHESLASELQTDARATRILCDALVSLELLIKQDGKYKNSPIAAQYLVPYSTHSKLGMMHHVATLYETWGRLYDVVKTGEPVNRETIDPRLKGDEKGFAAAMADVARHSARQTAENLNLAGVNHLLDIGGGPGLYAIEFAKRHPDLKATIMDNEKTVEVAKVNIRQAGLEDRVFTHAGDALSDEMGNEYDCIFMSNLIHAFSAKENAALVKKCAKVLAPGGRICIKDFVLSDDRTAPAWNALFSINMLVNTEQGDCYTKQEITEWLQQAGLEYDSYIAITPKSSMVIGKKA